MCAFQPSVQPGSFSSRRCGAWSVEIRSIVPSASAAHSGSVFDLGHVVRECVRAEPLDVPPVVAKEESPWIQLGGDILAGVLCPAELVDNTLGLRVQQVEGGSGRLLDPQEECCRRIPDDPVVRAVGLGVCLGVVLAARPEALFDVRHQSLIVGVDHERQTAVRDGLEDRHQLAMVVDADPRHMRVVAAGIDHHEDLEGGDPVRRETRDLGSNRSRRVDVPVDEGLCLVEGDHGLEPLHRIRWRVDVRHRERRRHATCRTGRGFTDDVALPGEARFAVV